MLGRSYAAAIVESGVVFDVIFGPAYKGISLAALTAAALYEHHGIDVPFAYNRKEKKAHGEGGHSQGGEAPGGRARHCLGCSSELLSKSPFPPPVRPLPFDPPRPRYRSTHCPSCSPP